MFARTLSTTLLGLDAVPVEIETQIIGRLRRFTVVGLPDNVLRESKERVRLAIENSGFAFPHREVVVNLAPASLPKRGSGFDLAIAISILAADGQIPPTAIRDRIFTGELALDGTVKPVVGELAAACYVRHSGERELIVAKQSSARTAAVQGAAVVGVHSLAEAVQYLNNKLELFPAEPSENDYCESDLEAPSFSDVIGQLSAKRALEIAAAGGHNCLLIGPPGSGKSMLARRLPSILPPLALEEQIEVAKVYGALQATSAAAEPVGFRRLRPFRSPHHTTSTAGLIGGGSMPVPGEISLAHCGVLFLDELPELRRDALESLREPLESRVVTISRAKERVRFPADFMLVAAMNPCPCGRYGAAKETSADGKRQVCECLPAERRRYLGRISGPILDRIDLQVWVPHVPVEQLAAVAVESNDDMVVRVRVARKLQQERFQSESRLNSAMPVREASEHCGLTNRGIKTLELAAKQFGLSARGYTRVLRVSRTIADLASSERVEAEHLNEALSFRQQVLSL